MFFYSLFFLTMVGNAHQSVTPFIGNFFLARNVKTDSSLNSVVEDKEAVFEKNEELKSSTDSVSKTDSQKVSEFESKSSVKKETRKQNDQSKKKSKKADVKKTGKKKTEESEILFSGTLLTYPSENALPNQFILEPMFFFANTYGSYDSNGKLQKGNGFFQYEVTANLRFGLAKNLDLNFITSVIQTQAGRKEAVTPSDTLILLGLQLMREKKRSWKPDIRLSIGENFPTGKFDLLDMELNGGEAGGIGSFETTVIFSIAKTFPISKKHAIRFNPNLYFFFPSSVETSGMSIFGAAPGIEGKAYPENKFSVDLAFEYNITRRLIFGLDIFYNYEGKVDFENRTANIQMELPATENFSLAPCIEYTFCEKFGMEAALWFSVSGRNSFAFITPSFLAWWIF